MMGRRRTVWDDRRHELDEAAKDLAFALVKVHEGKLPAALLNVSMALVHISKAMNRKEFEEVFSALKMEAPGDNPAGGIMPR